MKEKYFLKKMIFNLKIAMPIAVLIIYCFSSISNSHVSFAQGNNSVKPITSDIKNNLNQGKGGQKIENQFIVLMKEGTGPNGRGAAMGQAKNGGAQLLYEFDTAVNGFTVKLPPNSNALEALSKNSNVESVENDVLVTALAQTLPIGINRIDADMSSTSSGDGQGDVSNVIIAVLDTGIDITHPDLNVNTQGSVTFVAGTSTANDDNGHGTHVAGIAAAKDDGVGVVGVAPGAALVAIKVLDSTGSGSLSTIIKGIDYVTKHANEIDVVNMSLGFEGKSKTLDRAINKSISAGVTYVVAAGNSNIDAANFSPASNPNVITVSSIADSDGKCGGQGPATQYGSDDTLSSYSNFGSIVDIAAPGTSIYSTYKAGGYTTLSGTSMASPHVAGAAALYKSTHPTASPSDIRNALVNSGSVSSTSCDGNGHGYFTADKDSSPEPLLYVRGY